MTEHGPSSQRLVFVIIAIKGKPALPVKFAPAVTGGGGRLGDLKGFLGVKIWLIIVVAESPSC